MRKDFLQDIICSLLVILLTYAAVSKLLQFNKFSVQLSKSPVIGRYYSVIAILLPIAELIVVWLLLVKRTRLKGLYASFCMLVLFTVYIIAVLNFSNNIPCSCGGVLQSLSWKRHVWFNIAFIVLSLTGMYLEKHNSIANSDNSKLELD